MYIDFTPEQKKLRNEVRAYYRDLFTPELRAAFDAEREEMGGPVFRENRRADGTRWLARNRLAQGIWRPGPNSSGAVHLLE